MLSASIQTFGSNYIGYIFIHNDFILMFFCFSIIGKFMGKKIDTNFLIFILDFPICMWRQLAKGTCAD